MKQGEKTKQTILEVSNKLFYEKGYNATSFSQIVEATGLSKGNITYHFKSKQEILTSIIQIRLKELANLYTFWEQKTQNPKERLVLFLQMILYEKENIQKFGCSTGTLTSEFSKNEPILYAITLPLFTSIRDWLIEQFTLTGLNENDSYRKAMELLVQVQGLSLITHSFKDLDFLKAQIKKLKISIYST